MPKNYNALFEQDPVAFMRKYACNPKDSVEGHLGTADPVRFVPTGPNVGTPYDYRVVPTNDRIAWLDFQKVSQGAAGAGRLTKIMSHHATGQIEVVGSFTLDNTKVKSYFLPWNPQNIISLKIPSLMAGRDPGASYFFTAAINGCSVFIKGTSRSPHVFHGGGSTGYDDPASGAKFWEQLMQSHTATQGEILASVNKVDYTVDKISKGKNNAGIKMTFKHGTAHSRKFESWLKKEVSDDYLVESVAPTGCVMGVRDTSGEWSFYLQENATITYFKFNKVKTGFFGTSKKTKIDASMNVVMRPLLFRQIFPGDGHVKFTPNLTRVLKD